MTDVEHKNLRSLTKTEAAADALYRAVIGLDTHDLELWTSAWSKEGDVVFDLFQPLIGHEAIKTNVFDRIANLETQHTTSNVRVDLSDSKTAKLTAYAVNHHFRKGEGKDPLKKGYTGGATYHMDLVEDKSDGLWKIKNWKMQLIWADGDSSVMD